MVVGVLGAEAHTAYLHSGQHVLEWRWCTKVVEHAPSPTLTLSRCAPRFKSSTTSLSWALCIFRTATPFLRAILQLTHFYNCALLQSYSRRLVSSSNAPLPKNAQLCHLDSHNVSLIVHYQSVWLRHSFLVVDEREVVVNAEQRETGIERIGGSSFSGRNRLTESLSFSCFVASVLSELC